MRVCIRGIRQLDFTTPDGEVKGTQIFFSHPSEGVTGEKTDLNGGNLCEENLEFHRRTIQ